MDFGQQTADYMRNLSGPIPANTGMLRQLGLPETPNTALESCYWEYFDNVYYPLTALGEVNETINLFTAKMGTGRARNLDFPLPADTAFINYLIQGNFTFAFEPFDEEAEGPDVNAETINQVLDYFFNSSTLLISVSNKAYLNTSLRSFVNYSAPNVLRAIDGQTAPAPFATFPPAWAQHHRAALQLSPAIIWPASSTVTIQIQTNTAGWWKDVTGDDPDDTPPWLTKIRVVGEMKFGGNQLRVTK